MTAVKKSVFVIMPFRYSPTRGQEALTAFFEHNLKRVIEAANFGGTEYVVSRSADTFDIGPQIIRDLFAADIVICDLSGRDANPNVMYELGVRLSVGNKPVILIREAHPDNSRIFDISGFHTHEYDPLRYGELEHYLLDKIRRLTSGVDTYTSPVVDVLSREESVVSEIRRAKAEVRMLLAATSIGSVYRKYVEFVVEYVHRHSDVRFSEDTRKFNEECYQNFAALSGLNWSTFEIYLGLPAPLASFLTDPPFAGVLPSSLEMRFLAYLIEFESTFSHMRSGAWKTGFHRLQHYGNEALLLMTLIGVVQRYIRAENEDVKRELVKQFDASISQTILDQLA